MKPGSSTSPPTSELPGNLCSFRRSYAHIRANKCAFGDPRFVVIDADGFLHPEATAWLQFLTDVGRSPNTVRDYGRRVAWYLSWCALTMDWRKATLMLTVGVRLRAVSPVTRSSPPAR
jgi:hypothetical protein